MVESKVCKYITYSHPGPEVEPSCLNHMFVRMMLEMLSCVLVLCLIKQDVQLPKKVPPLSRQSTECIGDHQEILRLIGLCGSAIISILKPDTSLDTIFAQSLSYCLMMNTDFN